MSQTDVRTLSNNGVIIRFEEKISIKTNAKVKALYEILSSEKNWNKRDCYPIEIY